MGKLRSPRVRQNCDMNIRPLDQICKKVDKTHIEIRKNNKVRRRKTVATNGCAVLDIRLNRSI